MQEELIEVLEVMEIPRVFKFEGKMIELADPDPSISTEDVLYHYSAIYPELVTAKIIGPEYGKNKIIYTFSTLLGTKG